MYKKRLREGRFIKRLNRFVCLVDMGEVVPSPVHVPSSGRMAELLVPGARVIVQQFGGDGNHKTKGRLLRVLYEGKSSSWVSVDSHLPNRLFSEAIVSQSLPQFRPYGELRAEVTYGESRLDFLWRNGHSQALIEVKSVTLVKDGIALFPDAPTTRGTRHVKALMQGINEGYTSYLVFIIQRGDAHLFSPNGRMDPAFAHVVSEAVETGVTVLAYDCGVSPTEVVLRKSVPVRLD